MEQHLKLFTNHSAYNAVKNQIDTPNVVMCQSENEIHYNKVKPAVVITMTLSNDDELVWIYRDYPNYDENLNYIEIDGVRVTPNQTASIGETTAYGLRLTSGNHTVKYYLNDDTRLSNMLAGYSYGSGGGTYIADCTTNILIPETITTIDDHALNWYGDKVDINVFNLTTVGDKSFSCEIAESLTLEELSYINSCYSGVNSPFDSGPCK